MDIKIKQSTYYSELISFIDANGYVSHVWDGKEIRFTLKNRSDILKDDSAALIIKDGTVANGSFLLELSITDTTLDYGSYKCDFRLRTSEAANDDQNTDTFIIELTDKTTQQ